MSAIEGAGAELETAVILRLPGSLRGLHEAGRLSATGLVMDDRAVTYEDFERVAGDLYDFRQALDQLRDMCKYWIGDLIVQGEEVLGDDGYQAFESLGLSPGALQDWSRVTRNVLPGTRRPELTWTHHRAVASWPQERHEELLTYAVDNAMTVDEFRGYLRDLDHEVKEADRTLSAGGSDSRSNGAVSGIVVERLVDTARLVYRQGQVVDGGAEVRVPVEPWRQLGAALGEEEA